VQGSHKTNIIMTLSVLPDTYAVCRLAPTDTIPLWALNGDFFSITRTSDELSLVMAQSVVPIDFIREIERDWRILKVEGPLDFSLVGILASLTEPLANAKISIFAISTYDTDYILVKNNNLGVAIAVLEAAGHTIHLIDNMA
jgi:uncharacterized protein